MNRNFDKHLEQIEGMKWLPFIGTNYFELPKEKRILIIGESHYMNDNEEDRIKFNNPEATRIFHEELGVDQSYYRTKIYQNLYRALFGNDDINGPCLWQFLSFYNFIQRPMVTKTDRPNKEDSLLGWNVFFQLLDFLAPSTCLFIGTSSYKFLKETASNIPELNISDSHYDMIGNCIPRTAEISTSKVTCKLIFIKHTRKYFSPMKWNSFLMAHMNDQILWMTESALSKEAIEE